MEVDTIAILSTFTGSQCPCNQHVYIFLILLMRRSLVCSERICETAFGRRGNRRVPSQRAVVPEGERPSRDKPLQDHQSICMAH